MEINEQNKTVTHMARIGLVAKGVVYLVLGALAFMAAFEIAGRQEDNANRSGTFEWIRQNGGAPLLAVLAAGLICYTAWRLVQAFSKDKKMRKRLRYIFSGLAYGSIAFTAIKFLLQDHNSTGGGNQKLTAEALNHPLGVWAVWMAALGIAANGVYQVYYGLAGKYRDHVQTLHLGSTVSKVLLRSGYVGYIARGVVWLLLAFLLARAGYFHRASEAGDTGKAFRLVEHGYLGSYILGVIGIGVAAYGIFNFTRARYERW